MSTIGHTNDVEKTEKRRQPKQRRFTKKKKYVHPFADVPAKVDTSPPKLDKETNWNMFQSWVNRWQRNNADNLALVLAIKRNHYNRGKVDCHWDYTPQPYMVYYYTRVDFLSRINFENKFIYDRIITTNPKVQTTASLMKDWERNRRDILERAEKKFVLFPLVPCEDMEDVTFASPKGVKRPRIYLTISHHKCSPMGELQVELFTDVCPQTCELFTELLMGDGLGYGYVGTSFFRKVPHLYWSGGDVVYDNGFGCYAQRGRNTPIGAENYHFSHTMPGLLTMRVTCDDEMCGIFSITFKPLSQFDLKNVVFGRVIRPSDVYNSMREIGNILSIQPIIQLTAARRRVKGQWQHAVKNNRLIVLREDKRKMPDVGDAY